MVSARGSQPNNAERRLQNLGIQLPSAPTPFGNDVEATQSGNLLFPTRMLPVVDHKPKYLGRLGKELDIEAGRDAAYTAALSATGAGSRYFHDGLRDWQSDCDTFESIVGLVANASLRAANSKPQVEFAERYEGINRCFRPMDWA